MISAFLRSRFKQISKNITTSEVVGHYVLPSPFSLSLSLSLSLSACLSAFNQDNSKGLTWNLRIML